jgi:hypothetical protein
MSLYTTQEAADENDGGLASPTERAATVLANSQDSAVDLCGLRLVPLADEDGLWAAHTPDRDEPVEVLNPSRFRGTTELGKYLSRVKTETTADDEPDRSPEVA